ncbi:MAG: hydroxyisourate hydrolase [Streptosporangiaceae bacterium]
MSVSVHVIDCVYGKPAVGVPVRLACEIDRTWIEQWHDRTDEDGRAFIETIPIPAGSICRLEFSLDPYFATLGARPFYPVAVIGLRLPNVTASYHIGLLVTPNAYAVFKED